MDAFDEKNRGNSPVKLRARAKGLRDRHAAKVMEQKALDLEVRKFALTQRLWDNLSVSPSMQNMLQQVFCLGLLQEKVTPRHSKLQQTELAFR